MSNDTEGNALEKRGKEPVTSRILGIQKVLIANRGEIAVRVARTLRRLGIASAAVVHAQDRDGPTSRTVDEACPIEGKTPVAAHLDGAQIIEIAQSIGADALHPGYGFLAENAEFAASVEQAGIRWIGPGPEVIRLMGDKIASRRFVAAQGFELTPSASEEEDPASFAGRAREIGFPLLIKASAGGGGKGMQIVRDASQLEAAITLARSEAERYFGDGRIYAERYVEQPRHIEVQILADAYGRVLHLGERDCSIQRRFQKLIEESPAPSMSPGLRDRICEQAVAIARAAGYRNAGTVEFILAPNDDFYFLEMNTRLQVEHPVTEMVTGVDLVEQQVRVAAGEALSLDQGAIRFDGASIECRLCAEDPDQDFRPAVGQLLLVRPPGGEDVRFDGGIAEGQHVTTAFDPMLAKLIVHAASRDQAIDRARRALRDTILLGCTTNAAYLERILTHPDFRAGRLETGFIAAREAALAEPPLDDDERNSVLAAAALVDRDFRERVEAVPQPHASMGAWRN
jgi:propionyl-CoA carboxylase alpha chain/3-methylcrotonyl-CoA carboxylase alpha subunit/acetyl-CoA/propionyl-CoA carboxylase biotin carboxyl carrier protein